MHTAQVNLHAMMASASTLNKGLLLLTAHCIHIIHISCCFVSQQSELFCRWWQFLLSVGATRRPTALTRVTRTTANWSSWRRFIYFHIAFPSNLYVKDNYNKKIAPFSFDKVNNINIPVNINVSMSVIDIIKIEEVDHIYTLKFRLVLEWWVREERGTNDTCLMWSGTTTGWNISTWRRLGRRTLSPWKMSRECGFPSSSLTILRRMKQQRLLAPFSSW